MSFHAKEVLKRLIVTLYSAIIGRKAKMKQNPPTLTFEVVSVSESTNSGLIGSGPTGSPKEELEPEEKCGVALGSTFSLSN